VLLKSAQLCVLRSAQPSLRVFSWGESPGWGEEIGGSWTDVFSGGGAKAVIPSRSVAKLETLASLQMPFELKALEVCLDSVGASGHLTICRRTSRDERLSVSQMSL
jgi:hypothetical protein